MFLKQQSNIAYIILGKITPVSYTHLDVYKRQTILLLLSTMDQIILLYHILSSKPQH